MTKIRNYFLLFLLLINACSRTGYSINSDSLAKIKNTKTISYTSRARNMPLLVYTPSSAIITALIPFSGYYLPSSKGSNLVAKEEISDSASYGAERIAKLLASDYNIQLTPKPNVIVNDTDDVKQIAEKYKDSDLVVDSFTYANAMKYFSYAWGSYKIMQGITIRVIDTKDKKLVSSVTCFYHNPDTLKEAPSYKVMTENKAAKFKSLAAQNLDKCVDNFKTKLRSLAKPV